MTYITIATGETRPFEISGGLVEGYGEGKQHDLGEVVTFHHFWQNGNGLIQGVRVLPCTISYGGHDGEATWSASEPGFILSGGINVLYDGKTADGVVLERLLTLADFLAEHLNQTRIYVTFCGVDYIRERETTGLR